MSSNSIVSSFFSERRWIQEMNDTFPREHVLENISASDFAMPPCVFRVPKSLSETKPEAYVPQLVGLGPYHHLKPELYTMQRKKVAAVMKFLEDHRLLQNFQPLVEAIQGWEPYIRASYDQYLDLEPQTLSWIVAIDSVYLIQLLKLCAEGGDFEVENQMPFNFMGEDASNEARVQAELEKVEMDVLMLVNQIPFNFMREDASNVARVQAGLEKLAADVLMLENQIPFNFITSILTCFQPPVSDGNLLRELRLFCKAASPLELDDRVGATEERFHLLHIMYNGIVQPRQLVPEVSCEVSCSVDTVILHDTVMAGAETAAAVGVPGAETVQQLLSLAEKIRWDRISCMFRTRDPDEQNHLVEEEIDIPSVSKLKEIAGINFTCIPDGRIRDIKFDEEEKKFHLPIITIKSNSEVILRNLMAYEAAAKPASTLELTQYVDLMCGIVDTPKDVDILRNEGIIKSGLSDAEIAGIFNGIRKSTGNDNEILKSTNIQKIIDRVNERYSNLWRIKASRFIKKYARISWRSLTVLSTVLVLLLLVVQVFCQIYGCSKRWFSQ